MRVCLLGPLQSGKTSLFSAIVEAGGSSIDVSRPDQAHSAVIKVPDSRLDYLQEVFQRDKTVYAELEITDLPGFDLSDSSGRERAKVHWPAMRQSDMLVFVVRSFESPDVPPYLRRVDPGADVRELVDEMLFADLEQVSNRIEKLEAAVKKPTPDREDQLAELEIMKRLREALENEQPLSGAVSSPAEQKLLRSFGFLSLKPALAVINCGEQDRGGEESEQLESVPAIRLSAEIEMEIAQLPEADRGEFLADMGLSCTASDRMVRACCDRMDLISFLTVGDKECRAWMISSGTPAVEAAGKIHTDMARGFIRAETVSFEDFSAARGEMKQARADGKVRLEGKEYIVQDGDIINFRFNV
jgi:GTP-binding protein YchF